MSHDRVVEQEVEGSIQASSDDDGDNIVKGQVLFLEVSQQEPPLLPGRERLAKEGLFGDMQALGWA